MRRWVRAIAVVCLSAASASPTLAQAQTSPAVTLSGVVVDPSGAAIPHAEIVLHGAAGDRQATADGTGRFNVALPAANYDITVSAEGFRPYTRQGLAVGARNPPLSIRLEIAANEEQVDVSSSNSLSTDSSSNKSALVFSGDKLDQFSDDPTIMTQQLNALGNVDPTQPPQLYIDGFSGGTLPPKESIREIRINQNPVSAQYDSFGQGRIEIFTKPGANKLHGMAAINVNQSSLNAPNPYVPVQPAYNQEFINANINGPLGKNSSFYLSMQRNQNSTNAIVTASDPAAYTLLVGVTPPTLAVAVANPTLTQNYSLRFDRQFGKSDTFIGRYIFAQTQVTNGGVGQFVLPSEGYNSDTRTQTLQMTDTHLFSAKIVSDTAFQWIRTRSRQDAVSGAPAIVASGAFNAGGSPTQALHDNLDRLEFREEMSIAQGTHFIRTGGRYRLIRDANLATAGYNGQFIFPSYLSYQLTEQGLARGDSDSTIRNLDCYTDSTGLKTCGGATQMYVSAGQGSASLLTGDLGIYGEDEWKATKSLTLNYGLRLESQSAIPDHLDVGPRVGFAYAIKTNPKAKDPVVVIRGGFGLFYQRFASSNLLQSIRQNGVSQHSYYLANPSSDVYNPNSTTPPSTAGLSTQPSTIYNVDPHLRMPMQMQGMAVAEHAFKSHGTIALTYYQRRTVHMFDSVNVNAPLPNGTYPLGTSQAVYQFASGGISNGHTLVLNPNINFGKKFSFFGAAVVGHQESDTSGGFASNSYDLKADAGRAGPFYSPRQLYTGFNWMPAWGLNLNMFFAWRSDNTFNITTGADNNGDTIYNDRPSFATAATPAASLVKTAFGNFDITPQPGETIIPINYGNAPGQVFAALYAAKNFYFGPRPPAPPPPPAAAGAAAPAPAKPGAKPDLPPKRYRLNFSIDMENAFNHLNAGAPVGVLTSPYFGKSNTLTLFNSNPAANRTITFRTAFFF